VAAPVELVLDPVVKEDFAHLEEGGRRQERVGAGLVLRADPGHLEVVEGEVSRRTSFKRWRCRRRTWSESATSCRPPFRLLHERMMCLMS